MIIDSDVLIDYFRGFKNAKIILAENIPFKISSLTLMELFQGAQNKEMLLAVEKQMRIWKIEVLPVTAAITARAVQFVREFTLSHGIQAGDALIAATAIEQRETLLTGNEKHFACIPSLDLKVFHH